ncbi:TonB-dependent copper receptor [Alcaligenes sp. SDU_A2]|uniref:TonB-dependent copper receptor n=1 Tax=Alcaligenes sp. SDU_A2 TaxID=3136634 RepID=UPI00311FD645
MKKFVTPGLISAGVLAWTAHPVQAQPPSVETLSPIVVTGVAPESPLQFSTNPRLPRLPLPASDGTDYLKTIPGFAAIRNGGSNGDPVLRGMFGSRLAILANGSAMPGACPGRMDAPTSYISPQSFDELNVIKGPQSVRWGPGASAGTVRFERKPPRFTGPDATLQASLLGGSWGRHAGNVDFTAGNAAYYARLTANQDRAQDYKDGNGQRVPSRWKKWNTDIAVGLTPDPDTVLELSAGTGDGYARYAGRGMDGTRFKRETLGLRFQKDMDQGLLRAIEAQLYYNYADHVMDNYELRPFKPGGGMSMPMASNVDRLTWGARLSADWALRADLTLTTGLDMQRSRHRKRSAMGSQDYRDQTRVKDAEFDHLGLFAETRWELSDRSRLIGGARLDKAGVKDWRTSLGSGMMSRPNPGAGQQRRETLPSGFLRWEHDLDSVPLSLYAGLGHVQRMPDYWELFSPRRGPQGSASAFLGIQPEKTTQLDIGAQYKSDTLTAWASAYAGHIQDYILFDYPQSGMAGAQARNVQARIMGAEVGADIRASQDWTLGATLAYAWGRNRSDGRPLPQMPPLDLRLSADYARGAWSAGGVWRLVAAQRRYARGQGNVVGYDFGPSAGFGTLSLYGGYQINRHLSLTAGVDNVFDKAYSEHLNLAGNSGFGFGAATRFNDPGRTVWLKAALSF